MDMLGSLGIAGASGWSAVLDLLGGHVKLGGLGWHPLDGQVAAAALLRRGLVLAVLVALSPALAILAAAVATRGPSGRKGSRAVSIAPRTSSWATAVSSVIRQFDQPMTFSGRSARGVALQIFVVRACWS